ncbi:hypothetical protein N9W89_11505 [Hellea sp.]|nr:hypothetical protein [Hellea sp.]
MKWPVILVLAIMVTGITIVFSIHHKKKSNGYCFDAKRYLSQTELRDAAVEGFINRTASGNIKLPEGIDVPAVSVSNFIVKEPDCCHLKRDNKLKTIDGLRFIVPLEIESNNSTDVYRMRMLVTPCGYNSGHMGGRML